MKFNTLSILEKIEVKRYIFDLIENGAEDEFNDIFDDFIKLTNIDRDDSAELFNKELAKNYDDVVIVSSKKVEVQGGSKLYDSLDHLTDVLRNSMTDYRLDVYDRTIVVSHRFDKDRSYQMVVVNKSGQFYLEELL